MYNELYHWKYIKREKDGDGWKYYYNTTDLKNARSNFNNDTGVTAKKNVQVAQANLNAAKANEKTAKAEHAKLAETYRNNVKNGQKIVESGYNKSTNNSTNSATSNSTSNSAFANMANKVKEDRFAYSRGGNGRKSDEVKTIQTTLKDLGYDVSTDGTFDTKTYKAVMAFQRAEGIRIDGIVGEDTVTALEKASGAKKQDSKEIEQLELANAKARTAAHKRLEAGERYAEANKEYMNTPLHALENAAESTKELFNHAKKWASYAMNSSKKKSSNESSSNSRSKSSTTTTRSSGSKKRALIRDDYLPHISPSKSTKTRAEQRKKKRAVIRDDEARRRVYY